MAKFAINWTKAVGQYGLMVLTESGLCTAVDVSEIESGCTRRFQLVAVPNASGAVLKSLDGTQPQIRSVRPTTQSNSYSCVKINGITNPHAAAQPGGRFKGQTIHRYEITWQQVGGVA